MIMALSLIALAFGYKTFIEANEVKNASRRSFGRIVGIYIMTVAFAVSVGVVAKIANDNCKAGKYARYGKMCPVLNKNC